MWKVDEGRACYKLLVEASQVHRGNSSATINTKRQLNDTDCIVTRYERIAGSMISQKLVHLVRLEVFGGPTVLFAVVDICIWSFGVLSCSVPCFVIEC